MVPIRSGGRYTFASQLPRVPRRSVHRSGQKLQLNHGSVAQEHRDPTSLPEQLFSGHHDQKTSLLPARRSRLRGVPRASLAKSTKFAPEHSKTSGPEAEKTKGALTGNQPELQQTILVIRNASRHLDEHDFRRVIPEGKHIRGWHGQGNILRVISVRDKVTLLRTFHYYLVFETLESARAYESHVRYLHGLARTHMPTSFASRIPPPPGYLINGEDVYRLMQVFALMPPSQDLDIRVLTQPFPALVEKVLSFDGFTHRTTSGTSAGHQVMLQFEGPQPTLSEIKRAMNEDGKDRGLHWALLGGREASIRNFGACSKSGHDEDTLTEVGTISEMLKDPKQNISTWIVSFKTSLEAARFVRAWHRRSLPSTAVAGLTDVEDRPMVNAHIL